MPILISYSCFKFTHFSVIAMTNLNDLAWRQLAFGLHQKQSELISAMGEGWDCPSGPQLMKIRSGRVKEHFYLDGWVLVSRQIFFWVKMLDWEGILKKILKSLDEFVTHKRYPRRNIRGLRKPKEEKTVGTWSFLALQEMKARISPLWSVSLFVLKERVFKAEKWQVPNQFRGLGRYWAFHSLYLRSQWLGETRNVDWSISSLESCPGHLDIRVFFVSQKNVEIEDLFKSLS